MTSGCIKIVWKFHIFIVNKGVGLSLDVWYSWKALTGLLLSIYLMLELLYHKHNPLITTIVYEKTFLKRHLRL